MVSMNQARAGRTVYSGGSFAPTRGPVSGAGSMGYVNREMRNGNRGVFGGVSKFGRDGKSDTRSGVAANALRNRNRWAGQEGKPGWQQQNGGRAGTGMTKPNDAGQQAGELKNIEGDGAPVGSAAAAPSPATPTVTVNNSGQLELPYSEQWSQDILSGLQDSNDQLLAVNQEQQAQAAQYALQQRMAEQGYGDQQRNTLNSDSGRGMAFSSGHAYNVGTDANNYNNTRQALDMENATANAGFDTQRTTITNAFKDMLRQSSLSNAQELDDDAGNLGYGDPGLEGRESNSPINGQGGSNKQVKVPKAYQHGWKPGQPWAGSGTKTYPKPKKPQPPKKTPPSKPGQSPPRVPGGKKK